ncbi:MAG: hypothetical protein ACTSYI_01280 [Promethearchaeota archaeon]
MDERNDMLETNDMKDFEDQEELENIENIPEPTIIFDKSTNVSHPGEYKGGIIVKLQHPTVKMIFSDHIILTENSINVKGLAVGTTNGKAFSTEQNLHLSTLDNIIYVVRLDPEIVKEFDSARFSAQYPSIVRFLQTTILYMSTPERKIDHLDFVAGEILHRPVALLKNHGLIIGDRLVGEKDLVAGESQMGKEEFNLVFYDCIIIGGIPRGLRENDSEMQPSESNIMVSLEHFMMFPLEQIEMIFLLGTENF